MLLFGSKKGYLRTLEVIVAFVLTFSFLVVTLYSPIITGNDNKKDVLSTLAFDEGFREGIINLSGCEYNSDKTLLTNLTSDLLSFNFAICKNAKPSLPLKNVYVDSVLITGNITDMNLDPVKLYYWE